MGSIQGLFARIRRRRRAPNCWWPPITATTRISRGGAVDEGWRSLWWYSLKQSPVLESLHDEPEYQAMVAEIEADMVAQLERVREMERNGELEPIPVVSATIQ